MRAPAVVILAMMALAVTAGDAAAAESAEEQRGADLLSASERGDIECGDLDTADNTAIGEFAMGRMLGSPEAHEAMDSVMSSMMGEAGLERMHEVMGVRFSGCGNPSAPSSFGGMMAAIGGMGGGSGPSGGGIAGGSFGAGGSAPESPGQGFGTGTMMDFGRDGDGDFAAWMAAAMLALLAGAAVAFVVIPRIGRRHRTPAPGPAALDILTERFAHGAISAEEFAERRRLLERGER